MVCIEGVFRLATGCSPHLKSLASLIAFVGVGAVSKSVVRSIQRCSSKACSESGLATGCSLDFIVLASLISVVGVGAVGKFVVFDEGLDIELLGR